MGRLLEPGNSSGYHKAATLLQNGDAKLMQKSANCYRKAIQFQYLPRTQLSVLKGPPRVPSLPDLLLNQEKCFCKFSPLNIGDFDRPRTKITRPVPKRKLHPQQNLRVLQQAHCQYSQSNVYLNLQTLNENKDLIRSSVRVLN